MKHAFFVLLAVVCAVLPADAKSPYVTVYSAPHGARFQREGDKGEGFFWRFSIYNKGVIRGSAERDFGYDSSTPSLYYNVTGKIIGKPTFRNLQPREDLPVYAGSVVSPSDYKARIRMRLSGGIVIRGTLETTVRNAPPTKLNGVSYHRYRVHYRFHGTISDPSVFGMNRQTFTLKRTDYPWIDSPGAD